MNKSSFSLSQFNGIGIDAGKKTSYFWDYNNYNAFLCPICAVIYSCMPLGFNMKYSEGIFINCNSSVEILEAANSTYELQEELEESSVDAYQLTIDNFICDAIDVVVEKEIDNIQVVRMTEKGYIYNILSKDKLFVLHNFSEELKYMIGKHYSKTKNKKIYIYKEVLNRILNNITLYPIIYETLLSVIKNGMSIKYININNILLIQSSIYFGGEKKLKKNNNYRIMLQGDFLRKKMMGDNKNEKKVKSLSYVLINDLRMKNAHDFLDKLLRQYITFGMEVPGLFLDALNDEDNFLNAGYAFLIGLNGGCVKTEIDKAKDAQNNNEQAQNYRNEEDGLVEC
jgi:CRISPR-associated protein Cst1